MNTEKKTAEGKYNRKIKQAIEEGYRKGLREGYDAGKLDNQKGLHLLHTYLMVSQVVALEIFKEILPNRFYNLNPKD